MLKIKDNVDLKELEKFGFGKIDSDMYRKKVEMLSKNNEDELDYELVYTVDVTSRKLKFDITTYHYWAMDFDSTLYDLIKADLVEEVSNE